MFALAEPPEAWDAPTACDGWTTRDIVGHIVDTTEGYFRAFDAARGDRRGPRRRTACAVMHERANEGAHGVPRRPAGGDDGPAARPTSTRCRRSSRRLGPDDWTGLMVTHAYMGPVPGLLLRGRPADGLRRPLVGHPAGQRPGARPVRRRRGPAGAVHVRDLAGHGARPRR